MSHDVQFICCACAVPNSFVIRFNRSMTEASSIKSAVHEEEEKKYVHISDNTFPTFMNLV